MWLLILSVEQNPIQPQQLAGPVSALLKTSTESAMTVVMTLYTLAEHDMLECFLPFQLEYAFAAAMLLSIMETILPSYVPDGNWSRSVSFVLDEMINKKNAVARLRRSEIEQLHTLLLQLHGNSLSVTQNASPTHDGGQGNSTVSFADDLASSPIPDDNVVGDGLGIQWTALSGIGNMAFIHSNQMVELAEQFQIGELDPSWLFEPQL
jgi:proline utilization trans-activator